MPEHTLVLFNEHTRYKFFLNCNYTSPFFAHTPVAASLSNPIHGAATANISLTIHTDSCKWYMDLFFFSFLDIYIFVYTPDLSIMFGDSLFLGTSSSSAVAVAALASILLRAGS